MTHNDGRPVAIVTGSSSGIGRAIAAELASAGRDLVLHGLTATGTAETERLVEAAGGACMTVLGDIREPAVAERLAEVAHERFGRIDNVVNNAGAGLTRMFSDLDDPDWQSLLQMHLLGPARLLRAAHQGLREHGGAAVNISSLASHSALSGRAGYGAAKAALDGLTRQLAAEWAPDGIRVNAVAPGTIETPFVERNFEQGLLDRAGVLGRTPLGRLGAPSEIATVTRFLLDDDASYVTGQTICVDGGWSIWGGWE